MDTESSAELERLRAENDALLHENALFRAQLEDMVKRFESVIAMLRVISGSRVAEWAEQQKAEQPKFPESKEG
jgi:hypothetical protein